MKNITENVSNICKNVFFESHHVFIDVPFDKKDIVKREGAKWDTEHKKWFVEKTNTELIKMYPLRTKYYIDVKYDENDEAKRQGAKWDTVAKMWYTYDIDINTFPEINS